MTTPAPDYAALSRRLEKLERQRYLLLFVATLALAFAGAGILMARNRPSVAPLGSPARTSRLESGFTFTQWMTTTRCGWS